MGSAPERRPKRRDVLHFNTVLDLKRTFIALFSPGMDTVCSKTCRNTSFISVEAFPTFQRDESADLVDCCTQLE